MIFTSLLTAVAPFLGGLVTSTLPNVVKYMERGQEYKHEMALIKLQMEAQAAGLDHTKFITDVKATVDEGKSLRDHDMALSGDKRLVFVRGAIRPFLTIFFFLFWLAVKVAVLVMMLYNNAPAEVILSNIWDEWAQATFSAVIGFWFGTRAIMYTMDQYAKIDTAKKGI